MLREAIEATGIQSDTAATLLGVNPSIFQEWIAEQRPIPHSFVSMLSTVIGIDLTAIAGRKVPSKELAEITPAIWYRFRQDELISADREYVFLIRQLGYYIHELEEITDTKLVGWKVLFQEIRDNVDKQAPPRVQGRQAARMFREMRSLSVGADGIGEVIRGNLRSMGLLVIETPVPESKLEGCCFFVGSQRSERPCIFVNSHHSTWFRRNIVLMHELAHAIFDAESVGAALDFFDSKDDRDISEERADAFAQEAVVPVQVLKNIAQGIGAKWEKLDASELARLVASAGVEQRTLLKAALEAELISTEQVEEYASIDIAKILPKLTEHALSTADYIRRHRRENVTWLDLRDTVIPSRKLRLPSSYVAKVIDAFKSFEISAGKASEMLMIDEPTFVERFGAIDELEEILE